MDGLPWITIFFIKSEAIRPMFFASGTVTGEN